MSSDSSPLWPLPVRLSFLALAFGPPLICISLFVRAAILDGFVPVILMESNRADHAGLWSAVITAAQLVFWSGFLLYAARKSESEGE